MGLWTEITCPSCGMPGARKFLWMVKCDNPKCAKNAAPAAAPKPQAKAKPLSGNFDPGANGVTIRYRNHRGEEKSFTGDRGTLRVRGKHISLCLAPTGNRASFLRARILNPEEIDPLIRAETESPRPTPVERQILGYYKKRGGTSPRHQEVLRKYGLQK